MPEEFTNRELAMMLKEQNTHLLEIKTQVITTNGRVKKLELWRMFLTGAWAVLTIITPVAWFLISQAISNFNNQIETKINQAIIQYDKQIFKDSNGN